MAEKMAGMEQEAWTEQEKGKDIRNKQQEKEVACRREKGFGNGQKKGEEMEQCTLEEDENSKSAEPAALNGQEKKIDQEKKRDQQEKVKREQEKKREAAKQRA